MQRNEDIIQSGKQRIAECDSAQPGGSITTTTTIILTTKRLWVEHNHASSNFADSALLAPAEKVEAIMLG